MKKRVEVVESRDGVGGLQREQSGEVVMRNMKWGNREVCSRAESGEDQGMEGKGDREIKRRQQIKKKFKLDVEGSKKNE